MSPLSVLLSLLFLSLPLPIISHSMDGATGVPGSQVSTSKGAALLRGTLSCFRKRGTWERSDVRRRVPWIRESYGRKDQCDVENEPIKESNGTRIPEEVLEETKWKWKVPKCRWEKMKYEKFCRTLSSAYGKDASILVVGDELGWGMERRLLFSLLADAPEKPLVANLFPDGCSVWDYGQEKKICSGYRYCGDILGGPTVAVRFILNRDLNSSRVPSKENGAPWLLALSFWRPTVIVLTHTKTSVDEKSFEDNLLASYIWLRKHYPDILLIYRSNPKVRACLPPSQEFPEDSNTDKATLDWNRDRQNEIAKKLTNKWGGLYLDVDEAVEKRNGKSMFLSYNGGRSQNCINLCHPGPLDSWVDIFYNTLLAALPPVEMKNEFESDSTESQSKLYVPSKLGKITVDGFVRKAPKKAPVLRIPIPGSKIQTTRELENVDRKFNCFAKKGKWVYNSKPRLLAWPRKPLKEIQPCDVRQIQKGGVFGLEADEIAIKGGNWSIREDLKWDWETPTCPIETFSREKFCKMMGPGRSILFLGDSMSIGFYRSLLFNLMVGHDAVSYPPVNLFPGKFREWDVGLRREVCEGFSHCQEFYGNRSVEVRLCFNRGLTLTEVPLDGEAPWAVKLEEWKPSILVLNRGAHYREDAMFESGVRDALRYIRERLPKSLLLWRNTAPGHVNCMTYDGPISAPQDPSLLPYHFHWADFRHQNDIARKYVEEVGGVYMDIEHSTSLRPDGHRGFNAAGVPDCLHYCQPGIPDIWTQLMYNFFKELL